MRQTGVLAAAALYALDHHVDRLADDHRRAAEVAAGLAERGYAVVPPDTNLLIVGVPDAPGFVARLEEHGVRCFPISADQLRMVFHIGITDEDVPTILAGFDRAH